MIIFMFMIILINIIFMFIIILINIIFILFRRKLWNYCLRYFMLMVSYLVKYMWDIVLCNYYFDRCNKKAGIAVVFVLLLKEPFYYFLGAIALDCNDIDMTNIIIHMLIIRICMTNMTCQLNIMNQFCWIMKC